MREWRLTASNFGPAIKAIENGKVPQSLLKQLLHKYGSLNKVEVRLIGAHSKVALSSL